MRATIHRLGLNPQELLGSDGSKTVGNDTQPATESTPSAGRSKVDPGKKCLRNSAARLAGVRGRSARRPRHLAGAECSDGAERGSGRP